MALDGGGMGGGCLSIFLPALGHGIGPPQAVSILARHAREGGCPRLAIDVRSHGYPGSGQVAGPGHDSEEEARFLLPPPPRWGRDGVGVILGSASYEKYLSI